MTIILTNQELHSIHDNWEHIKIHFPDMHCYFDLQNLQYQGHAFNTQCIQNMLLIKVKRFKIRKLLSYTSLNLLSYRKLVRYKLIAIERKSFLKEVNYIIISCNFYDRLPLKVVTEILAFSF